MEWTKTWNLVGAAAVPAISGDSFQKLRPSDASPLCSVPRSSAEDIGAAVADGRQAQPDWAAHTPVERGELVREIALALRARRDEAAEIVVAETGKSLELALAETDAAVEMGFFVAGEVVVRP
jgi:acyl-CoA reductase-like NAD-dependent aldehyde dehydrogenase